MRGLLGWGLLAGVALLGAAGCDSEVNVEPSGGGGQGAGGQGSGAQGTGASGPGSTGAASPASSGSGSASTSSSMSTASTSSSMTTTSAGTMICPAEGPCGDCVSTACPEVWCSCTANPDCGALFSCTQGCMDQTCVQTCLSTYPDGISDAVLVGGCAADPCGPSCPMAGDDLSPCEECLYTSCSDEMNACLSNPECTLLWQCFGGCAQFDLVCQQSCYDMHGGGVMDLQAVFMCADPACGDLCN